MILQLKILGEDYELYKKLKEENLNVRLVKNAILIEEEVNSDNIVIPNIGNKKFEIYFKDTENGGGMTHRGHSHIVCGLQGEKLKPIFIKTSGHRAVGEHAVFAVKDVIITVDYRTGEFVTITKYEAKLENQKVVVEVEKLWEGYPEELPNLFQKYEPAVKASVEKANCYHCREPHYYREAS